MKRFVATIAVIGLGYAAAVVLAVSVAVIFMALPISIPGLGMWPTVDAFREDAFGLMAFGMIITGFFGLPGFVFVVLLSRRQGWSRWRQFAFAGCANAFAAIVLFHIYMGGPGLPNSIWLPCFPGGFAGGWIYWLIARRRLYPARTIA